MKKFIIPVLAIAFAFATSAFTAKKSTSSFYLYTGTTFLQADIQNINNYAAESNTCGGVSDVCGVQLTTAHTIGTTPVAAEFNAEAANLWKSEQHNHAQDGNISMQN